jgi:hypothetical protein
MKCDLLSLVECDHYQDPCHEVRGKEELNNQTTRQATQATHGLLKQKQIITPSYLQPKLRCWYLYDFIFIYVYL